MTSAGALATVAATCERLAERGGERRGERDRVAVFVGEQHRAHAAVVRRDGVRRRHRRRAWCGPGQLWRPGQRVVAGPTVSSPGAPATCTAGREDKIEQRPHSPWFVR